MGMDSDPVTEGEYKRMDKMTDSPSTDNFKFEQLFYFVFGISPNGSEQERKQKCVEKAYLDLCRTISYKKDSPEKKKTFKAEVNELILDCISNCPVQTNAGYDVFDEWHKNTIGRIKEVAKEYEDIFVEREIITVGQAQKWLNMTIKYMRIMGILPKSMDERYIHIPIDSFIMDVANKTEIISEGYDVRGVGIEQLSCAWSKLDNYQEYIEFQNAIRERLRGTEYIPNDWEASAWMAEATERAGKAS